MIQPKKIKVDGIAVADLMRLAGYSEHSEGRGWIRYFEEFDGIDMEKYRFHVYQKSEFLLEIHTDKLKKKGKQSYHIASTFVTAPEKKRIRALMPKVIKEPRKFKNQTLERSKYLQVMSELN